jgi:hypothetical protein
MKRSILILTISLIFTTINFLQAQTYPHKSMATTGVGYIPKMNTLNSAGYDLLNNSALFQNASNYIGINTTTPTALFSVGAGATSPFQINASGAIAAATGIISSGTIKFSGLTAGSVVLTTTGGQLTTAAALTVLNGGTGAATLTGILKGNGTGAFTALNGTANYLPKWTGTTLSLTSSIWDNGTYVGVGTNVPKVKMHLHSIEMVTEGGGGTGSPQGPMGPMGVTTYAYSAFQITNAATTEIAESGLILKQVDLNSQICAKSGNLTLNANGGFSTSSTNASIDANTGALNLRGANLLFHAQTGSFVFETPVGGNALTIANNGSVGIGMASPTEKLDITGNIKCTGKIGVNTAIQSAYALAVEGKMIISDEITIKIRTDWPDFVFNKEYSLLSLSDLEKFIKTNNHLPNVPSAKEVKNEGVNVSEMNAILLQKVEELTLYIINQDKKINELEKKINSK